MTERIDGLHRSQEAQEAFETLVPRLRDTHRAMSAVTAKTRAVFLFHGSAEVRRVDKVPHRGTRVRSRQGGDWVVDDVLQSGADTYTVTCVEPSELHLRRQRGLAYLRRDREFALLALFWSALSSSC